VAEGERGGVFRRCCQKEEESPPCCVEQSVSPTRPPEKKGKRRKEPTGTQISLKKKTNCFTTGDLAEGKRTPRKNPEVFVVLPDKREKKRKRKKKRGAPDHPLCTPRGKKGRRRWIIAVPQGEGGNRGKAYTAVFDQPCNQKERGKRVRGVAVEGRGGGGERKEGSRPCGTRS